MTQTSSWIVTLDVFKYLSAAVLRHIVGWIVTLDVFKFQKASFLTPVARCWIVTLDVFKFVSDTRVDSNYKLNSNIRCI